MAAVAMAAARRGRLPLGQGQSMHTGAIAFGLLRVAALTINRQSRDIVVRVLCREVRVATDTEVGFVDRSPELGQIDEQGHLFAGGVGRGERLVPMTFEAGAVLDWFGGRHSR